MSILLAPILTEKSMALSEKQGIYAFRVKKRATKTEIKNVVAEKYEVIVRKVNTMNVLGKSKVQYTRKGARWGKRSDFKKAIVLIGKGQVIDFHNIEQTKESNVN